MGGASAQRDEWGRRAGAFYPLLVALGLQTRFPILRTLRSDARDEKEAMVWLPLIGAGQGILLAFLAAISVELGLSAMVTGVLLAGLSVVIGAGLFEYSAASLAAGGLEKWQRQAGEGASDRVFAIAVVACLLILLRVGSIASIGADELTPTLIAASVVSRWVIGLHGLLGPGSISQRLGDRGWLSQAGAAVAVWIVTGVCLGAGGLVLLCVALLGAWGLEHFEIKGSDTRHFDQALAYGLFIELLILL